MNIELALKAVCRTAEGTTSALSFLPALVKLMPQFGVTGSKGVAAFLAQCAHESGGFRHTQENLNYSAEGLAKTWPTRFSVDPKSSIKIPNALALKIANKKDQVGNYAYANRIGNGSPESGDGYKFRGRGLFQLTGRSNYELFAKEFGSEYLSNPDLVAQPEGAVLSALWFWRKNKIGEAKDFTEQTRKINGGTIGLDDRLFRYNAALAVI